MPKRERTALQSPSERPEANAQAWFREQGKSVTEWSLQRGFAPALVYAVLKGERKCLRGQSFKIAVALGMRPAPSTRGLGPQLARKKIAEKYEPTAIVLVRGTQLACEQVKSIRLHWRTQFPFVRFYECRWLRGPSESGSACQIKSETASCTQKRRRGRDDH